MRELSIIIRPISEIKEYENNAKRHPKEQIEQIKNSIEEFGFNDPIAIYDDGTIAEGHGRFVALKELGVTEVPCFLIDELSEEEKKAYRIIHNQLTFNSSIDDDKLKVELENIKNIDMQKYNVVCKNDKSYSELFMDAPEKEKEPKKVQCPACGKEFEI